MNKSLTRIELAEKHLNFAVAHFVFFSATSRERLHGHNYRVKAVITSEITAVGLCFDYEIFISKLHQLCQQLDHYLLLPELSPVIKISTENEYYLLEFNQEKMFFLKNDVLLLPLHNISIEELAEWFLQEIVKEKESLIPPQVKEFTIKVSNGEGRWAGSSWQALCGE